MELTHAINTFTQTLATAIPVAIGLSLVVVIGWVFTQDYLRNRARTQNKMWRDL